MSKLKQKKIDKETIFDKRFACDQCSVVCASRYGLAEHLRKHTGDKPFTCTKCNISFKRLTGLRKHKQYVHNASGLKQYKCPECILVTRNLGNVLRHYLVVHRQLRRFICSICLSQYSQNQELKSHLSSKHNIFIENINSQEKKSICEIYVLPSFDLTDQTKPLAKQLKEIVDGEKEKLQGIEKFILSLKNCCTETEYHNDVSTLETSRVIDTNVTSDLSSDVVLQEISNEDENCGEKLALEDKFEFLSNSETKSNESCPETWISFVLEKPDILYNQICYENCIPTDIFLSTQEDNSRLSETNIELIPVTPSKVEWKCDNCLKVFTEEKKLFRHLKIHTDHKKFKCNKCGKCFHEQHNLNVHYRSHSEERPYKCPVCDKQIRYHKDFVDHCVSHSGEKRYACDLCSKKFPRKRDCDRHKFSHNPHYRFHCEICGKGFLRRYLMLHHVLKHERSENQQQPVVKELFECSVCRKQYKTSHRFLQHKTKHTGMNDHQCHICSKSFISTAKLEIHLRNHIPRVKNVSCSECQRKFSSQDTLKIHMDRYHKHEKIEDQGINDVNEEGNIVLAAIGVPIYDYEIVLAE